MQKQFIITLSELAEKDKAIVFLTADNGTDYDKWFKADFPDRYYDLGISECNLVSVAAGMASVGKIPFIQTGGSFLAYRALEFIRNDVCLQKQNVKIIGTGSGLSISNLGPTHHSTEDIAILRTLPGLTILSPATTKEVKLCMKAAYEISGPVYIRLGMGSEIQDFDIDFPWSIEGMDVVVDGKQAVLFSTGSVISEALKCREFLQDNSVKLVNVHTLKPLDDKSIIESISSSKYVFTLEEHSIYGGLGGVIAEIVATNDISTKLTRIGIKGTFAKGYGNYKDIRRINGIDSDTILSVIQTTMES